MRVVASESPLSRGSRATATGREFPAREIHSNESTLKSVNKLKRLLHYTKGESIKRLHRIASPGTMKFKAAASDDMLRRSYSMPITPTNTASATTTTTTTSGGVVLVSSPKALLSASSSSSLGIIAPVRTAKSEEGISISSAHSQTVAAASTADTPTTRRRRGDSTSSNNTGAGGTPSPSKSNHATGSPNSSSNTGAATTSKNSHHKLDRYGFILNMDSRGNIQKLEEHNNTNDGGESESPVHSSINGADNSNNTGSSTTPNGLSSSIDKALVAAGMASTSSTAAASSVPTDATRAAAASQPNAGAPDLARTARRIVKWNDMLAKWTVFGTTAPAPTLDSCNATTTKTATRTVAKRRTRRHALLKKRLRKGIPDSMRATVWPLLCHVDERMQQHPGLYWDLVEKSVGLARTTKTATGITNSSSSPHETTVSLDGDGATTLPVPTNKNRWNGKSKDSVVAESASVVAALEKKQLPVKFDHTKSFKNIQETIERDIHRTFPRHSLFYSDGKSEHASESSDDEEEEEDDRGGIGGGGGGGDDAISIYSADLPQGLCGTAEISSMIRELDLTNRAAALALITRTKSINKNNSNSAANTPNHLKTASSDASQWIHSGNSNGDRINQLKILQDAGGQSRLRRVLKAYSTYDREIGYCQGMNFIAAMFLTLVSEEKAFWMLVGRFLLAVWS